MMKIVNWTSHIAFNGHLKRTGLECIANNLLILQKNLKTQIPYGRMKLIRIYRDAALRRKILKTEQFSEKKLSIEELGRSRG